WPIAAFQQRRIWRLPALIGTTDCPDWLTGNVERRTTAHSAAFCSPPSQPPQSVDGRLRVLRARGARAGSHRCARRDFASLARQASGTLGNGRGCTARRGRETRFGLVELASPAPMVTVWAPASACAQA